MPDLFSSASRFTHAAILTLSYQTISYSTNQQINYSTTQPINHSTHQPIVVLALELHLSGAGR
jgi:hypothetical protein